MNSPAYQLSGLVHQYGPKTALLLDELNIDRGSIVGLAGPNGSGKSTLLRILALLERPTQGRVVFLGQEADFESARQRREVTLLLQDPYLLKRTVLENVAYGLRVRGDTNGLEKRVEEALEWVGLVPGDFMGRSHGALSGGEAQRVALAARLILRPRVLLLDEPTASVDTSSARLIREAALRARRERGCTLVVASHDQTWLEEVADQTFHLHAGRVAGAGPINLIRGPWQEQENGSALRELDPDNRIVSPGFIKQNSTAMLDPGEVSLHSRPPQNSPGFNLLFGKIISLNLTDHGSLVRAGISVAGLVFTACLDLEAFSRLGLNPGDPVWLTFEAQALKWL